MTPPAADKNFPRVRSIHIDTDPGLDDLLALALALASPEARLESITTVAGNASLEAVTENAGRFMQLAGIELPLGRGASEPLQLRRVDAEEVHGVDGRGGVRLPEPARLPTDDAISVLRAALSAKRIEKIIALGPLTNLALLLDEDRALLEDIEIVWMGGTLSEGNVTPLAEFNAYADPVAARNVLRSGLPVRVIGLDVTRHVQLRESDLGETVFGTSARGRLLEQILHALMEAGRPVHGEPCAVLHDPCAVAAALFADGFRYEPKVLEVGIQEDRERGRLSEQADPDGPHVRYAVEVQNHAILRLFLERLRVWSANIIE